MKFFSGIFTILALIGIGHNVATVPLSAHDQMEQDVEQEVEQQMKRETSGAAATVKSAGAVVGTANDAAFARYPNYGGLMQAGAAPTGLVLNGGFAAPSLNGFGGINGAINGAYGAGTLNGFGAPGYTGQIQQLGGLSGFNGPNTGFPAAGLAGAPYPQNIEFYPGNLMHGGAYPGSEYPLGPHGANGPFDFHGAQQLTGQAQLGVGAQFPQQLQQQLVNAQQQQQQQFQQQPIIAAYQMMPQYYQQQFGYSPSGLQNYQYAMGSI